MPQVWQIQKRCVICFKRIGQEKLARTSFLWLTFFRVMSIKCIGVVLVILLNTRRC